MTDQEKIDWVNENFRWAEQFPNPLDIDMYNFDEVAKDFFFSFLRTWGEANGKDVPDWF